MVNKELRQLSLFYIPRALLGGLIGPYRPFIGQEWPQGALYRTRSTRMSTGLPAYIFVATVCDYTEPGGANYPGCSKIGEQCDIA